MERLFIGCLQERLVEVFFWVFDGSKTKVLLVSHPLCFLRRTNPKDHRFGIDAVMLLHVSLGVWAFQFVSQSHINDNDFFPQNGAMCSSPNQGATNAPWGASQA